MKYFVWAHGLTSSMEEEDAGGLMGNWELPGDDWRVVRYDAPGHGTGPTPTSSRELEWEQLGTRMLDEATKAGADRFVAGGASMGAATSLYAALQAPDRIEALVLVIPPTAWETRAAQAGLYQAGTEFIRTAGMERWVEAARQAPRTPTWIPFPDRWDRFLEADPNAMATVFEGAAASDLPALADVATIEVPTLILAWADDPGHPEATAQWLAVTMPRATLVVAHSVGEVLAWKGEVRRFLNTL